MHKRRDLSIERELHSQINFHYSLAVMRPDRNSVVNSPGKQNRSLDEFANSSFFSAQDLQDLPLPLSRSRTNSMLSSSTAAGISDQDNQTLSFSVNVKKHYKFLVKILPTLIIFIPSIMKMFFPHVIKFGEFQIGDQKTHPSIIVIDIFSILLICWVLRFLLDWPWKWYLQIRTVKEKLCKLLDLMDQKSKSYNGTIGNIRQLKIQRYIALSLCFIAPLLCGWILLFSRDYILTYEQGFGNDGDKNLIFSDLNIGIFISFGLIRLIIQLSEHLQLVTASLEADADKVAQNLVHLTEKYEINNNSPLLDHVQELNEKVNRLENKVENVANKFEVFYRKNKFTIENDQTFLSSKHFKILEKEINEMNHKITVKSTELENKILMIETAQIVSPPPNDTLLMKQPSLHGIPLPSKEPTYLFPNKTSPSYPMEIYSNVTSNPLDRLNLNSLLKFLPSFSIFQSEEWQSNLDDAVAHHIENIDNNNHFDYSRPIVGYVINFPFIAQRIFWKLVSYIPLRLLKIVYVLLLFILDALIDFYHNKMEHSREQEIMIDKIGTSIEQLHRADCNRKQKQQQL